ncbi:S-methyl-5-thioribose-1-phosphate isomerase [Cognatazoarcus halotolerans]|uniref:S-methyl-5-thioribose-1-phosphate isomerase n=1 Tax=Cognatazoarcus halotolerans TaxID=2686016 RepID=UPI00135AC779|nr:S-methyl-5-thioribose-1-phosphate isomerase [Cognatazoarcus halotolerans]MBX3679879.1 S-methyl-5-thioribose-1-phosphate isomerase [Rhodocyclaceae bacterium]MCP5308071.1 S-methyl-5-thioribose-1-phosphate isomerase [Zoogloeaceae bacterium]
MQTLTTLSFRDDHAVILDQTALPYRRATCTLDSLDAVAHAIRSMQVRGAPLIGATAACGVAIALRNQADDEALAQALDRLAATRPTAVNLRWALERLARLLRPLPERDRAAAAAREAHRIIAEDADTNRRIGEHGLALIRTIAAARPGPVRVMTHCNAGWLATCGYGTALAPVYAAREAGIPTEVWVSETRPRNQGLLTAWELGESGVPFNLIADNAAGFLLARGDVDLVITGADRVAANGDSANKIGTYLKALAANDNAVPFYIASPASTIDFGCPHGGLIPIEDRGGEEIRQLSAPDAADCLRTVHLANPEVACRNPAFDVTPARLITGIITECGISAPGALTDLFPEHA